MAQQVIYLEKDDDIHIVRTRLRRAQSRRIILVVPRKGEAFRRPLDFRLLRRQAIALGLAVAVVTPELTRHDIARAEGIPIFESVEQARRSRWDPPRGHGPLAGEPSETIFQTLWYQRRPNLAMGIAVLAATILIILTSAWVAIPHAVIAVTPAREPIRVSLLVDADPSLNVPDWETRRMPAQLIRIEVEGSAQTPTTGTQAAPDAKATGVVVFVNLTRRPLTVPKGTIVSTSAGTLIRFVTTADVSLPGRVGAQAQAPIEAMDPGPIGNVRAGWINRVEGPLAVAVRVINDQPTSGGTVKQVNQVSASDKERVRLLALEALRQKAHTLMNEQAGENAFIPLQSVQIDVVLAESYDHFVGEAADSLSVEMRAVASGISVSRETATQMAYHALSERVRGGFTLLPDTLQVNIADVIGMREGSRVVQILIEGSALMEAEIDTHLLQRVLRGRPIKTAQTYLRSYLPIEEEPQLTLTPSWFHWMPWLPQQIEIRTNGIEEVP